MNQEIVDKAYKLGKALHQGQKDDDGKDYFEVHVQKVVFILRQVTDDSDILAAAYLHDTLEDTGISYVDLANEFGTRIAGLVYEVTHEGSKDTVGYSFPRLHSREAIMIKFADRLSNISRMSSWDEKRQQQYLKKSKFWKSLNNTIILNGEKK